jgi:hypothetical protein
VHKTRNREGASPHRPQPSLIPYHTDRSILFRSKGMASKVTRYTTAVASINDHNLELLEFYSITGYDRWLVTRD